MSFVQNIGWLLFLAAVMLLVSMGVKAVVVATWEAASQGDQLDGDSAIRAFFGEFGILADVILLRKTAAACAAVVFVLVMATGVDLWASAGFLAMTFVIVGFAVPALQRRIRPIASSSASAKAEVVRQEPKLPD